MPAAFLIRLAGAADLAALQELIEQSVRQLSGDDYSAAQIDGALGTVLGLDTQLVEDGTYFVASHPEHPHVLAGCGGWSYRKTLYGSDHAGNRESTLLDPARDAARIRAIFVHPDWARRGLGTFLLKRCEDAAAAAGFRRFEMGSTLTGVPLYAREGYKELERIEVDLPNGATLSVVRMARSLEPGRRI